MRKRLGAAAALAITVVVLAATPALAHVNVDPDSAPKGGFVKLTFRVPNEEDSADTVKVDLKFDDNHPIASVAVKPKAGWTVDVRKTTLKAPLQTADGQVTQAVSEITWSGGKIAPGQFDEFEVSVGPLPADADVLLFPTVQTYSDGSEVSWVQQAFEGQPEPDHPAPQVKLTSATGSSGKNKSSSTSSSTKTLAI